MKTFSYTKRAWATSPTHLDNIRNPELSPEECSEIQVTDSDMAEHGWIEVGTAVTAITFAPDDQLISNTVSQLEATMQKLRTDTFVKLEGLRVMKENLLALTYNTPESAAPMESDRTDDNYSGPPDDDFPF